MPQVQERDEIRVLLKRKDLLDLVVEHTHVDRTEVVDWVEQSRPTVYRSLDQLAEIDVVTNKNGTYTATTYGLVLQGVLDDLFDRMNSLRGSKNAVLNLPKSEIELFKYIDEATFYRRTRIEPRKPVNELKALVESDGIVSGLLPILPFGLEDLVRLAENGLQGKIHIERSIIEHLEEKRHRKIQHLYSIDGFEIKPIIVDVHFGLVILENSNSVLILSHSDEGTLLAIFKCELICMKKEVQNMLHEVTDFTGGESHGNPT